MFAVIRVAAGSTCHVAYVDGAVAQAETLAREAADGLAAGFDCAGEPGIIGEFSAWPVGAE